MAVDDTFPSIVVRYETLRDGALGQPIAPEHRNGLVVLLRRGMWAWVRAISDEGRQRQSPSRCTRTPGPARRTLVHLLADLTVPPTGRLS